MPRFSDAQEYMWVMQEYERISSEPESNNGLDPGDELWVRKDK